MKNPRNGLLSGLRAFARDEQGTISTEYLAAIAIVVMMAVPVVAVVGDGSQENGHDLVVNIQETDSMGGRGFHGGDALGAAAAEEELYNPGADLGVGIDENGLAANAEGNGTFYVAGQSVTTRRDKPQAGGGSSFTVTTAGGGVGGGGSGAGAGGGNTGGGGDAGSNRPVRVKLPKAPSAGFATAAAGNDCVIATADAVVAQDAVYIVASGR